jgi:hypothetical protein
MAAGCEQRRWNGEVERLGGGQIDDEIELGRLLDRDIAGLRPAQYLVGKIGGAPERVREVYSIVLYPLFRGNDKVIVLAWTLSRH